MPGRRILKPRKRPGLLLLTPTFIQGASAGPSGGASTNLAFGSNVTAGSLLVAAALPNGGPPATYSITDNHGDGPGGVFKSAVTINVNGNTNVIAYAWNAVGGATTVTFTCSVGTDLFGLLFIAEYSGVMTTADPLDGSAAALLSGVDPISSGNFTTTVAGDLIFGLFEDQNRGVQFSDNGFTVREFFQFGVSSIKDMVAGAAGSYAAISNASGGGGANSQTAMGAAFKPPSTAPLDPIFFGTNS